MGRDMTEIGSGHAENLKRFMTEYKPKKIIETGTYMGIGSTSLIASSIRDLKIKGSQFCSIECNRDLYDIAAINLHLNSLKVFVNLIFGLSIPRELIPLDGEIQEIMEKALSTPGIIVDHSGDVKSGSVYYAKETKCDGPEDLLGDIITRLGFDPEFVLLDSGGHVGTIEFKYLISILRKPCAIALDDANHIKHFESKKIVLSDNRFKVLFESNDHTGSILAIFTP